MKTVSLSSGGGHDGQQGNSELLGSEEWAATSRLRSSVSALRPPGYRLCAANISLAANDQKTHKQDTTVQAQTAEQ